MTKAIRQSSIARVRPLFRKAITAYELEGTREFTVPMYAGIAERTLRAALKQLFEEYHKEMTNFGIEVPITGIAVAANHDTKELRITFRQESLLALELTSVPAAK